MGKRLRVRFRKAIRDQETAIKKNGAPRRHKVSKERSDRALYRKAHPAV